MSTVEKSSKTNGEMLALTEEHHKGMELSQHGKSGSGVFTNLSITAGTICSAGFVYNIGLIGASPAHQITGLVGGGILTLTFAAIGFVRSSGGFYLDLTDSEMEAIQFKKIGGSGYLKSIVSGGKVPYLVEMGKMDDGRVIVRAYRMKGLSSVVEIAVFESKKEETAQDAWDRALESAKALTK